MSQFSPSKRRQPGSPSTPTQTAGAKDHPEGKESYTSHQKTEKGLDRIFHAIQTNKDRKDTASLKMSLESRKTVNEIIREKSDSVSRRQSKETSAVDGPGLVTHLPDVVVQSDHRRPLPFRITNQAVLLFLDISGFTALCEKYSQAAKTGTEQLTKTLNGYMSSLVSEIISYDGDILKFAGDAILSMWPVDTLLGMNLTVENVIHCALDIQRKHGTYTTSDGVTLKVKICLLYTSDAADE